MEQVNKAVCKVIVVIVNYGNEHDTITCLKSLKEQNEKSLGIIVINNPKIEQSEAYPVKTELLFRKIFEDLHFINCETNVGFGRANNKGIRYALENLDFEYIFLLNNDAWVLKDTITVLIKAFAVDYRIGISTGKIMYDSNRTLVWYGGGEINFVKGWPEITGYNRKSEPGGAGRSRLVSFISGCAMLFSKESILALKGFDEDMFMYCEDMELSLRALKEGYLLYYSAEAVIYHKVQGSLGDGKAKGMTRSNPNLPFLFYNMKSNQWLTMKKHIAGWQFILFNCYFWTDYLFRLMYFMAVGRFEMFNVSFKTAKRIFVSNYAKA